MTDRTLPQLGVGVRPRPAPETAQPAVASGTIPVIRPAVARREAVLSSPARAGMLLGVSAAVYAVTLAGITGLQSGTDAATAAARAPHLDAVAESRAANDVLEARLRDAHAAAAELAGDYELVGTDIAAYQARLDELAALVAEVQGTAAALPARIRLPSVSIAGPIATGGGGGSSAPRTSAKSGGSGG